MSQVDLYALYDITDKKVYQKCTLETGRDTTDYYSAIREDADGTVYQKRENYTAKYNVYYEYSDTILYKFSPEPTIEAKDLSEAYKKNLYISICRTAAGFTTGTSIIWPNIRSRYQAFMRQRITQTWLLALQEIALSLGLRVPEKATVWKKTGKKYFRMRQSEDMNGSHFTRTILMPSLSGHTSQSRKEPISITSLSQDRLCGYTRKH